MCERESLEVGYVKGEAIPLGYIEVNHIDNPQWKKGSKYPQVGYQMFCLLNITEELPFKGEYESIGRKWITFKISVNILHNITSFIK